MDLIGYDSSVKKIEKIVDGDDTSVVLDIFGTSIISWSGNRQNHFISKKYL